jgi:hypothetical protein
MPPGRDEISDATVDQLWDVRFDALDELVETLTNEEETDGRHGKRK